jgi:hypothetical protein
VAGATSAEAGRGHRRRRVQGSQDQERLVGRLAKGRLEGRLAMGRLEGRLAMGLEGRQGMGLEGRQGREGRQGLGLVGRSRSRRRSCLQSCLAVEVVADPDRRDLVQEDHWGSSGLGALDGSPTAGPDQDWRCRRAADRRSAARQHWHSCRRLVLPVVGTKLQKTAMHWPGLAGRLPKKRRARRFQDVRCRPMIAVGRQVQCSMAVPWSTPAGRL